MATASHTSLTLLAVSRPLWNRVEYFIELEVGTKLLNVGHGDHLGLIFAHVAQEIRVHFPLMEART